MYSITTCTSNGSSYMSITRTMQSLCTRSLISRSTVSSCRRIASSMFPREITFTAYISPVF